MNINLTIAQELNVKEWQVEAAVKLILKNVLIMYTFTFFDVILLINVNSLH